MTSYVLAIDQGTTSTRAILFRADTSIAAVAQREFPQHFPADGEVEHEPDDLWTTTVATCRGAMQKAGASGTRYRRHRHHQSARDDAVVGPRHRPAGPSRHRLAGPAHRRPAARGSKRTAMKPCFAAKTGLLLDPYFSGTKLAWLLDNACRISPSRAARGELAFGTVDTYLLWRLTGGKVHATDATNASRTLLFDIHAGRWDDELLALLGVPKAVLPAVMDSSAAFGTTDPDLFGGAIPICGIAGDQQAALIGQACFAPGMVKSTYGTGMFRASQYRPNAGRFQEQAAHDRRLSARRHAHLRAGRLDLCRRRGRAMAARWPACRAEARKRPDALAAGGRPDTGRHPGAGLRRTGCAAIGGPMRAARCSA